jgi:transaldolase
MDEHIQRVNEIGQSLWIDNLHREMFDSGQLGRWIEAGVSGVTSNPTIFEKALRKYVGYRQDIAALAERQVKPPEIYDTLVRGDIQRAADLLRPLWAARGHRDGLVSLEVSPALADDTERTIAEAERLWSLVGRPNLMIKVPATAAGRPAIARLIERGIAVNVTLIFSTRQYLDVAEAYQRGLEARAERGEPLDVASVASVFVSRVDTAVDRRLPKDSPLRGRIAIANAKWIYQQWRSTYGQPRWGALANQGARPQRLLWGSTGTKDPAYSDVLYVEELIGPDTINTMPDATLEAFLDHGRVRPSLTEAVGDAMSDLEQLAAHGIDIDVLCEQLQRDGVRAFSDSFDALMRQIADEARALAGSAPPPA